MKGRFAAQLGRWVDQTKHKADEVVREGITTLVTKVISRSPVDTGLFRGSWLFTSDGIISNIVPDRKDTARLDKSPGGQVTIARIVASIPKDAAGRVYHLTNNQPYGFRLEYEGWSRQAPNGMVGISVKEFPQDMAAIVSAMRVPA